MIWFFFAPLLLLASHVAEAQEAGEGSGDAFKAAVRATKPKTPDEELASFTVPDGFEVNLFASETQIQKPLNMAFDVDGRLWLTGSNEYPYPAEDGKGQDSIRILEDTDGDGAADKVTVFADELNIPMGIYPYRDGAIVFSIPNILFLRDTNADGKADTREVLYGPFDTTRDTHGMNNAFRRGYDGWLYCCHGFNNQSKVAGRDNHAVALNSGNTYRIRLDGSRIEHFTHGQVNPFGMAIDANGDIFNSDCHTKPVSLLIRGGYYESFGKPHDGLGYVPPVMDHLHGSTAIDGLCQYQDAVFPDEFHDDLFVGNVMTSRVHRNSIVRTGSTIRMQEESDFLTSTDPWFRPVDIQVGHDGAMYIADFYNRIIGHYEVPLDHPGRDRSRGRIWRVAYVGNRDSTSNPDEPELTSDSLSNASLPELLTSLRDRRKFIRQNTADQIVDRLGEVAIPEVSKALETSFSGEQKSTPQLLWVLQRLGTLTSDQLTEAFKVGKPRTRIHVMRICSECNSDQDVVDLVRLGLRDSEGLVQRAAADAAAQSASIDVAKEVVNAMVVCPKQDVHLQHALKIALKNQLQVSEVAEWFAESTPPESACRALSSVVTSVDTESAGAITLQLLKSGYLKEETIQSIVDHATRNMTSATAPELFELAKTLSEDSFRMKTAIWVAMSEVFRDKDLTAPTDFAAWSGELAANRLSTIDISGLSWGRYSLDGRPAVEWGHEKRSVAGRSGERKFLSSLAGGEKGVGVLRSRPFVLPYKIELQICGHLGSPNESPLPENRVVLRNYETGQEIESALAPRNDVAATHEWFCGKFGGQRGYLEVVDGLPLGSYAWIAIGQPVPLVVRNEVPSTRESEGLLAAVRILRDRVTTGGGLSVEQRGQLTRIAAAIQVDGSLRSVAAESLLLDQQKPSLIGLADLLKFGTTPRIVDNAIVEFCTRPASEVGAVDAAVVENAGVVDKDLALVKNVFSQLDVTLRNRLVQNLAASREGSLLLLASMEAGLPSSSVLRDERLISQLSGYGDEAAARVTSLVKTLPDDDKDTTELSQNIVRKIKLGEGDSTSGLAVFEKHCLSCHRRGGIGGVAGPQLDDVSTRGTARLLEDILHPNRNVDVAFRTSTLQLTNGKVMTGIVRPGNTSRKLTVVTAEGKVIELAKDDVEERKDSTLSLMPGNVASQISEPLLLDLVAYLLQ